MLVIADGGEVPSDIAIDEDWVRSSASERDVAARLHNLRLRLERTVVLRDRVLRTHRGKVTLTEREAIIMAILLNYQGRVAPRQMLLDALGPPGGTDRRLHDVAYRLRSLIRPFGLDVFSARRSGYVLGPRIDPTPEPRNSAWRP